MYVSVGVGGEEGKVDLSPNDESETCKVRSINYYSTTSFLSEPSHALSHLCAVRGPGCCAALSASGTRAGLFFSGDKATAGTTDGAGQGPQWEPLLEPVSACHGVFRRGS